MLVRRCGWRLAQQCRYSRAVSVKEAEAPSIPFPREKTGLNYSLNWSLSAKAIPPQGDVFHNLKDSELQEYGATVPDAVSGSKIYARGSFSTGAAEITKPQFNKLFREVTQHLSACSKLFVQDGALGSSPKVDVKVRAISDSPSAASTLKNALCSSLVQGAYDEIPLTVYVASSHKPDALEDSTFLAADYDRAALVICGNAFADTAAVKRALAAFAAPVIVASGAVPLTGRLVTAGDSKNVIVAGPEDVVSTLASASVFPEAGLVWNAEGVTRLFNTKEPAVPKLLSPTSFVLITLDSTGALPPVSKLSPGQAAFHFLAGYDGQAFTPCYNKGLASVKPATLATELSALLTKTSLPAYLVNAHDGRKQVSDRELMKLIEAAASDKLPKAKKPSDDTVKAFTEKHTEFISKTHPGLPETIKI